MSGQTIDVAQSSRLMVSLVGVTLKRMATVAQNMATVAMSLPTATVTNVSTFAQVAQVNLSI